MEKNKKAKIAVIGVGNMGKNHARILFESKNADLVAICDIDKNKKEEFSQKYKCHGYLSHRDLLEKEDLDAVIIAVPTKSHKEIAVDCLKKKINVLVEKPIAYTLQDAQAIVRAAKKSKVILTVGHIERFNPAIAELKKKIDKGELGEIISIDAKRVGPFVPKKRDTGVILDLAVHDVDIFNYLLNQYPKNVYANGGSSQKADFEDYADIFLIFGKKTGHIQVNWVNPVKIRELSITGTKGYAKLNYITQELLIYKSLFINDENNISKTTSQQEKVDIEYGEPLKLEINAFIKCLEKRENPNVAPEQAKKALEITKKALKKINDQR